MRPDQARLLTDSRLTDAARIIGLFVSGLEPVGEPQRLSYEHELAPLIHGIPNVDTIGRHVRQLVTLGYLERRGGGHGTPGTLRWVPKHPCETEPVPDKLEQTPVTDRVRSPKHPCETEPVRPLVVEEGGSSSTPPIVPPSVSPRAAAVLESNGELLNGCREALRDYLERVPIDRQHGYAYSIVTWLQGGLGPAGLLKHATPPTTVLATALNELAGQSEELMKHPLGDIRNLRTKVSVLLREKKPHAPASERDSQSSATGQRSRSGREFSYE